MTRVVLLKSRAKNFGGLEKTASHIADAFMQRGADVLVACPSKWRSHLSADILFGIDRSPMQTHLRAGNGVHAAYLKSRLLAEGRAKYLMCLVNPKHRAILRLEKRAFEHPMLQKVFANSAMVKREILERFAIDPAKICVIHNGVEWREMQSDFENSWEKHRPSDQFQLLFVGNGYLRKGLMQLLNGMANLRRNDLHLSVVGKDRNQSFYEAHARKLGLSKQVSFFGQQSDVRPFYQLADALAIPSFYDPFANVTLEALAMGLFVLSSHSNGGCEVLEPDTGTCVDDLLSDDAMATALKRAMSNPKSKETALMRRRSVEHLDYAKQMDALIEACYG